MPTVTAGLSLMPLLKGKLYAGALFVPLLLGGGSELTNQGAGRLPIAHPRYWAWVDDKIVYANTYEAIQAAVKKVKPGELPTVEVANQVLTLPPKPSGDLSWYLDRAVVLANSERDKLQTEHERDEIGLILAILTAVQTGNVLSNATVSDNHAEIVNA
jgi:hypothetical protein